MLWFCHHAPCPVAHGSHGCLHSECSWQVDLSCSHLNRGNWYGLVPMQSHPGCGTMHWRLKTRAAFCGPAAVRWPGSSRVMNMRNLLVCWSAAKLLSIASWQSAGLLHSGAILLPVPCWEGSSCAAQLSTQLSCPSAGRHCLTTALTDTICQLQGLYCPFELPAIQALECAAGAFCARAASCMSLD